MRLSKSKKFRYDPVERHSFTIQQAAYLKKDLILKQWAGKSLIERATLFKKRFPYTHITVYKLRKFYLEEKIKKKAIRISKIPAPKQLHAI